MTRRDRVARMLERLRLARLRTPDQPRCPDCGRTMIERIAGVWCPCCRGWLRERSSLDPDVQGRMTRWISGMPI